MWAGGALAWAAGRPGPGPAHFFLACCAWALLCRIFFCRLGSFVAGFLAARLLVLVMACPPFGQKKRDGPDQRGAETNRTASDPSGLSGGEFPFRQGLPAVHPALGGRAGHVQGHCTPNPSRAAQSLERLLPDLEDGGRCQGHADSRRSPSHAGAAQPG